MYEDKYECPFILEQETVSPFIKENCPDNAGRLDCVGGTRPL
jgi:hypothetical protein